MKKVHPLKSGKALPLFVQKTHGTSLALFDARSQNLRLGVKNSAKLLTCCANPLEQ